MSKETERTTTEGHDVLDAKFFGTIQVGSELLLCETTARDMQHGLNAAVVQHAAGNGGWAGGFVWAWISSWMPRHITKQRPSNGHAVESARENWALMTHLYAMIAHIQKTYLEIKLTAPLAVRGGKNSREK